MMSAGEGAAGMSEMLFICAGKARCVGAFSPDGPQSRTVSRLAVI